MIDSVEWVGSVVFVGGAKVFQVLSAKLEWWLITDGTWDTYRHLKVGLT